MFSNIYWSIRILFARNFVVMDRHKSAIKLNGIDPGKLKNTMMLIAQERSLKAFSEDLHILIERHKRRIDQLERRPKRQVGLHNRPLPKRSTRKG